MMTINIKYLPFYELSWTGITMFILKTKLLKFREVKKIAQMLSARKAGFLSLVALDTLGQVILCCGWLFCEDVSWHQTVPCMRFNSTLGFYPLDARTHPQPPSHGNQSSPDIVKCPLRRAKLAPAKNSHHDGCRWLLHQGRQTV